MVSVLQNERNRQLAHSGPHIEVHPEHSLRTSTRVWSWVVPWPPPGKKLPAVMTTHLEGRVMSTCVDVYDLRRGLLKRDEDLISKLFTLDPVITLRELDYAMRGSGIQQVPWAWMEEPIPPVRHTQWLVELDRRLRRRIGWAQQRAADLHVLREAYRAGDLSLVLGAAVSMAAKMPGWKDLVVGILDLALSYRQRLIERAQRSSVVSHKGKIYLRDDSQDPECFVDERIPPLTSDLQSLLEKTREALKRSENYDDQLLLEAAEVAQQVLGEDLIAEVRGFEYQSRTLYRTKVHPAITRMIHLPGHPGTLTPRVWSIVTCNFDDLVEQTLRKAGHSFTVQLSRKGEMGGLWGGDRAQPSAVDILHVHGFAPNSSEWLTFPFWETDLVFTARQYEIQYGSDSTFTRKVHEIFLVNSPVLIIGSSLTDQYAVSELTAAHERRPGWFHYCVMQLPDAHREAQEELSGEQLENCRRSTVLWDCTSSGSRATTTSPFRILVVVLGARRNGWCAIGSGLGQYYTWRLSVSPADDAYAIGGASGGSRGRSRRRRSQRRATDSDEYMPTSAPIHRREYTRC